MSPDERLHEAAAKARVVADNHASSYPDFVRRSREALANTKRELAALQEIALLLHHEDEGPSL